MQKYIGTAIKKDVNNPSPAGETPAVGASVTVRLQSTNALATIYSDNGVTTISQPLITDSSGRYEFYAANDRYKIEYDYNGATTTIEDVSLLDINDIAIQNLAKATTAQAQAGADDSAYTTPLKVKNYVDQFGLGTLNAPNISDFNTVAPAGIYGFSSGALNRPNFTNGLCINGTADSNGRTTRIAISTVGGSYKFGYRTLIGGAGVWEYMYDTSNLLNLQNVSASTIASNEAVSGSNLNPAQAGTWRNASGNDIANNGYGLFIKD